MHRIGVEERRARLAVRHGVAPAERVGSVVDAARAVVCLHATDPATVHVSVWACMADATIETGNAGPTIWVDGRIAGGWACRANGEVVTKLLEDVGREAERSVDAEAARLTEWLRATGVTPRFPMPLQKELAR